MVRMVHIIDELKLGGAQTHLVTMLRYSQQVYPFDHYVVSLFGDGPVGDTLRELGISVTTLNLRPHFERWRFDVAVGEIKSCLEQLHPDLVEAHLSWSRLLGLAAARFAGIPRRIGFEQGDIYMNSFKFRLANYLSQLYTDRYIVCSDALRQWVRQTHHIRNDKMSVFHNCVDPERFNPHVAPASDVVKMRNKGDVLFVMVGTLGSGVNKRIDVGIRALAMARQQGVNASLLIVGDGDQRLALEGLTEELHVADHVRFLGMRCDIPGILVASDAFCHAAPFEPFGIVALEAMAVGIPVIVPDSGGIREAVDHMVTGFVYPALDAAALAHAMEQLSWDGGRRAEIGAAAHCAVEERFTVKQYVERLYTLYGVISS